jgi:hypothetical protein
MNSNLFAVLDPSEHGTPFPVIIQGQALLRLAAIVRDIDARLPTALRSQVIRW